MWAWPSSVPNTAASGLAPLNTGPVASTPASGYRAQPEAARKATRLRARVARLVIVNPRLALPSTRHSVARLGVFTVWNPAVRNFPCGV